MNNFPVLTGNGAWRSGNWSLTAPAGAGVLFLVVGMQLLNTLTTAQTIPANCSAFFDNIQVAQYTPVTAYRARYEAVAQAQTAFNLFPTKMAVKYDCANDSADVEATFVIRAYTSATTQVDLVADPLVAWAWRQLRLDPTLGGVATDAYITDIEMGYVEKSSSDQICVDISICVVMQVGRDDPTINKTMGTNL